MIAALHAAYVSGRSTAVSVCQAHLDRIAVYDRKGPSLGAIIINNPDALSDAAALDAALESTGKPQVSRMRTAAPALYAPARSVLDSARRCYAD
jgi:Asp-tRNA(Asn)/Glu-tRNA(Gln) amidotransferase A subunit family amidase